MKLRAQRVAELVRQSVGINLVKLMPAEQLSVTRVNVSDDLRFAQVWVAPPASSDFNEKSLKILLKEHTSQLQKQLGRAVKTKFTPKLSFIIDKGGEHAEKINKILKSIS